MAKQVEASVWAECTTAKHILLIGPSRHPLCAMQLDKLSKIETIAIIKRESHQAPKMAGGFASMAYQGTLGIERTRLVYALFLVCAGLAILGSLLAASDESPWRWLHYLTKPTAALLLFVVALRNSPASSRTYGMAVAIGLLFAAAGDTFLMLPGDYFLAGLICFLLTHCAYIFALTRDAKFAAHPGLFGAFALVAFAVVAGLWTSLPPEMGIPVIIYALALGAMAAQAVSRLRQFSGTPAQATARFAAYGGLLFMISDTLLAYGRFRWQIPYNALWLLGTYYAAQYFFARSTQAHDSKR